MNPRDYDLDRPGDDNPAIDALLAAEQPGDDAVIDRVRSRVMAHVSAGAAPRTADQVAVAPIPIAMGVAARQRRTSKRRVGAWTAVAGLAAAVIVGGVVVGTSGPGSDGPTGTTPAASGGSTSSSSAATAYPKTREEAEQQGASRTPATPAPGQYTYVRTVGPGVTVAASPSTGVSTSSSQGAVSGGPTASGGALPETTQGAGAPTTTAPSTTSYSLDEMWIPSDPTQEWLRRQTDVTNGVATYAYEWRGACGDFYANTQDGRIGRVPGDSCTRTGSLHNLTPTFVAALPRDPKGLLAELVSDATGRINPQKDHDVNSIVLGTVTELYSSGMAPADLLPTLQGVLARIPGIEMRSAVANHAGVRGNAYSYDTTYGDDPTPTTNTVIVDPATGAYLGDQDFSISTGVAASLGGPQI